MPSSLSTLLIVAFVSLFLGAVAGLLLSSLRGEREEEPQTAQETPPGGRPGHYLPLVRLWREKNTKTLVIEVEGKSYLAPEPLTPVQRESLENALAEFSGWLGVRVTSTPPQAGAARAVSPAKSGEVHPAAASGQGTLGQVEKIQTATGRVVTAPAGQPTWTASLPAGAQPPLKEEPKSIVNQIDAILQEMLIKVGMDNRGIALNEDPRRGVIVSVGLDRFDGIDAVTDVDIKKLLRAAVSEWERRQERPDRLV